MQEQDKPQDNPYLKVENPYEEYEKSQANNLKNKHSQDMLKVQRLCYQVFNTDDGKELYKELESKFLLQSLYNPIQPEASNLAMYWEGFRDCIRSIKQMCDMHAQMNLQMTKEPV
jgi:hypothetical protein